MPQVQLHAMHGYSPEVGTLNSPARHSMPSMPRDPASRRCCCAGDQAGGAAGRGEEPLQGHDQGAPRGRHHGGGAGGGLLHHGLRRHQMRTSRTTARPTTSKSTFSLTPLTLPVQLSFSSTELPFSSVQLHTGPSSSSSALSCRAVQTARVLVQSRWSVKHASNITGCACDCCSGMVLDAMHRTPLSMQLGMAVRARWILTGRYCLCRFNFDEMLNLNGNTAVYMLYAHARIASIVRKVGKDVNEVAKTAKINLEHPAEASSPCPALCLPLHVSSVHAQDLLLTWVLDCCDEDLPLSLEHVEFPEE